MLANIWIDFHCSYSYLHSICIILGIINNLEMIQSIYEDVCRFYANTKPFYIRDLGIHDFWYPWGSGTNAPWIPRDYYVCKALTTALGTE